MASTRKKIALIVYRFPPMGGIGSRRWAKFVKYLNRLDWEIHVITINYPWADTINWSSDVQNLQNLYISRLNAKYPSFFLRPIGDNWLANFFTKIAKRFYHFIYKNKLTYDHASLWSTDLVTYSVNYLTRENIVNLIVSGPPSSLHLAGALIKSEIPAINLVQDYRDPWSNVHDVYMKNINSTELKSKILKDEALSLSVANSIIVVTDQMKSELYQLFRTSLDKIHVICNGYDNEDYQNLPTDVLRENLNGEIIVCYTGQFGLDPQGRVSALKLISESLYKIDKKISCRFKFMIYSDLPSDYFSNSNSEILINQFILRPMVSHNILPSILNMSDICLSINRPEDSHAFGTKIFDYMAVNKPIFQISPSGALADFLVSSHQYVAGYDLNSMCDTLVAIASDFDSLNGLQPINKGLAEQFEFSNLAKKLETLLH